MKKTAVLLMIITLMSKILGFARELVLSYTYGASAITDAYLVSLTIPSVIFSFVSAGIATAFIPLYSRVRTEHGLTAANRFTSNLSNALFLVSAITVVFVLLFSRTLVRLFASGFTGETFQLSVEFTRISVFGIFFTALFNLFSSFLRINENYTLPVLVSLPLNLSIIVSLLVSVRSSVYFMAVGTVVAKALQILLFIPCIRRTGYRYSPVLDFNDEFLRQMLYIAFPVIVGTSVNEINVLVDRTLASQIAVGGISALNYAIRLNGFVQGIFVMSVTTVMFPMISRKAAERNFTALKSLLKESILIIILLVVPITLGSMIFSEEIVVLLFGRGAFTADAIDMTSKALFFYAIGMLAFGLRDTLSRAFYSLQDTKTPMINATSGVGLNIILNLILSRYLGIGGLALATSVSAILTTGLMLITLRRKIGGFGLKGLSVSFLKIATASLLMVFVAVSSFDFLDQRLSTNRALILSIGLSALVYSVLICLMRIPELNEAIAKVRKRFYRNDGAIG